MIMKDKICMFCGHRTGTNDFFALEAAVTAAMDNLMRNKTTVMIAHNYAATKNADYVIVMKDGTVEAAGSPEELLENNDYYKLFAKTL